MKEKYIYKINKTAGKKYLQIWEWNNLTNKYEYVKPCGTAESLYNKLVKAEELENQTKE